MNTNTSVEKLIDAQATTASQSANPTTRRPARWLMMVCCIAMALGAAGIIVFAPQEESWVSKVMLALPLLVCVGAHFLLHRLTGKHSCEQSNYEDDKQMTKNVLLATALLIATISLAEAGENINPKAMHIYKTPWCGCCQVWTDAMKKAGYKVTIENMEDLSVIKKLAGVPDKLESCHTAKLGDYVLEGHVPLEAIKRLMNERPKIQGLAVPGMPQGSLGMGYDPNAKYEVYSFTNNRTREPQVFYRAGE